MFGNFRKEMNKFSEIFEFTTLVTTLYYRKAEQHKRCVDAIDCTKDDELYVIRSIYMDLANGYMRLCENNTLPGCTESTFCKPVTDVCNINIFQIFIFFIATNVRLTY